MEIRIEHLTKDYGKTRALSDVNLSILDGELFFLLGPSGCGKTTLLRSIGGFEQPTSGKIYFDGEDVDGQPVHQRNTAMVFQGYALWPHLTVRENVAFGLEMKKLPKDEVVRRVDRVLREVQIAEFADRKPNQLSGGQQQRVALARTLVVQPGCLLLDEPLANLDAKLRRDMRLEIRRICKENHLTAIYVTHDRAEALSMADRLAVFRDGRIEQVGTPEEVYRRPVNSFVANFIGETNLREGTVVHFRADGAAVVETALGSLVCSTIPSSCKPGEKVLLSMRPEAFRKCDSEAENSFAMTLKHIDYLGELADQIGETADGKALKFFEINPRGRAEAGTVIRLAIAPEDIICLADHV
ncbi:MAG: ABC transporter ATP-binding protein [Victivallales bacterium]|nr:ABC transporter ATP-binding protein [Victivallales bacterium]